MPKSYRFRTEVGVDKEVRLNIEQDFDFLEILSLKLRQEDLYERFCADYGIVVGRVIANGGFGVPNATLSIFVPLDDIDESDPIISSLYPYKKIEDRNDDGYRYNLLPYEKEYGGHTPTGTFPAREDVLTRKEVLHIYEKYFKYTVKTNESGDFMIVGVPLGQQKLVMDLDLSNMGQFSLRPADLVRMGMGVPSQFNGQQFKASEDLNSLPQIVNSVREIEVAPFWGENELCDVGITRADIDLRDLGIEISPQSIFMGSIFSSTEDDYLRGNCKPKNNVGKLCDVVAGPGQILSIRQTIDVDAEGQPILEQYFLEDGGNVIDDNGAWMVDLPMNLDYVITDEFGEQIISLDPSVGIPTKGRYRFRIKYQNEAGLKNDIIRADYLIPNIREHGWSGTTVDEMPSEEDRNKSYAFSLDWDEYYDKNAAINCEDSFYQFNYNKVYTVASHLDRFKWGRNRIKHLGIKEINDRTCQSENNPLPIVDAQRNGNLLIFLFNFLISILTIPLIILLAIAHVVTFMWPIFRAIIIVISTIINFVLYGICLIIALFSRRRTKDDCVRKEITPPPKESPFSTINFPMLSYPDCEACACETKKTEEDDGDTAGQLESYADEENFGPIIDASYKELYNNAFPPNEAQADDTPGCADATLGVRALQGQIIRSGLDQYSKNGMYTDLLKDLGAGDEDACEDWSVANNFNRRDQVQWYKSPVYPVLDEPTQLESLFGANKRVRWKLGSEPTWAQALNLLNRRAMFYGDTGILCNYDSDDVAKKYDTGNFSVPRPEVIDNYYLNRATTTRIRTKLHNDQLGFDAPVTTWLDNAFIMVLDEGETMENGQLFFFNEPSAAEDPNFQMFPQGNQFDGNGITGTTVGHSNSSYIPVEFNAMASDGSEVTKTAYLYNTASTMDMKFKSGVEYFQCIKAIEPWEIWHYTTQLSTVSQLPVNVYTDGEADGTANVLTGALWRYFVKYTNYYGQWESEKQGRWLRVGDKNGVNSDEEVTGNNAQAGGFYNDKYPNYRVIVAVRGVDPNMPRQKITYDLSKLFGQSLDSAANPNNWNGTYTVTGDYFMNVPIQNNWNGMNVGNWRSGYKGERTAIPHYRLWNQDNGPDDGNAPQGGSYYRKRLYWHNCDNDGEVYNYEGNVVGYNFNTKLWHKPFLFRPDPDLWQEWDNYTPNKYISMDKQLRQSGDFKKWMGNLPSDDNGNTSGENCPNGNYHQMWFSGDIGGSSETKSWPRTGINPNFQTNIEGVGFQYSRPQRLNGDDARLKRRLGGNGNREVITVSPMYLPKRYENNNSRGVPKTMMKNSEKILFRSDRIPTSDKWDEPEFSFATLHKYPHFRRYGLHLNLKQQLFLSDDDGNVIDIDGNMVPTDASGTYLDSIEDTNCETAQLLSTFNCDSMVPLGCYSGNGENFGVEVPCDIPRDLQFEIEGDERLNQGCYVFVIKKPIRSLRADIEMLFEYRTRMRFMFSVCQGVIGESFQNNWLNGTLYMPTFQKQTLYNSDNEVRRYRYCGDGQQFFSALRHQGPIYFNNQTNSFYYRSTPFNDDTNQFVGQTPSRDYYYGQNDKNIWFPTTIMELGPRDEFTKEIAFSPDFEGYIIDTIKSTSHQDPSDVVNLFLLSRLVNTSFLEQLTNTGDASIGQLFSRELGTPLARLFDARVDGDFAQMVGINSEYGVVPFLDGNYCDDTTTVQDDRFGIWFSSNTIDRRILQNGVTTFGTQPEGPTNYFGYTKTQIVPYYMWNMNDNGLFGTEYNNWNTEYIFSSKYQGDDFFNGNSPYMKPNYGYGRGHIFNRSLGDPSLDSFPVNNTNSNNFKTGSPFYFYFGLKRGKSAMNRYIQKYIFNLP